MSDDTSKQSTQDKPKKSRKRKLPTVAKVLEVLKKDAAMPVQKKETIFDIIRSVMPAIKDMQKAGHDIEAVTTSLRRAGIDITSSTLKRYMAIIRKEERERQERALDAAIIAEKIENLSDSAWTDRE